MDRVQSSRVEQRPCSIRVRSIRVQNGRCSVRFNRVRVEPDLCSVRVWLNRVSNGKFEFETRLGSTRFDSIAISGCKVDWMKETCHSMGAKGPIGDAEEDRRMMKAVNRSHSNHEEWPVWENNIKFWKNLATYSRRNIVFGSLYVEIEYLLPRLIPYSSRSPLKRGCRGSPTGW